ncbi:MAG: metal-dependent hydrolase [Halodesulfurarchaeum sp.]
MMSTTHAAMGLAAASILTVVAPELAVVAGLAAVAGGVFPDLDLVLQHRKSLHHPELYPVLAALAAVPALLRPGPLLVAVAWFFGGAALHSLTDVLGGGLGLRPWESDDERGIYLHTRARWVPPRRWVRYDGAPEDLLVAVAFSIPPYLAFGPQVRKLILAGLGASLGYVLLRKRLVDVYERFAGCSE